MKKTLNTWTGLVLGGVFLWIAFSGVSWDSFISTIKEVQLGWLLAGAVSMLFAMGLRAFRWFLISGLPKEKMNRVWDAACVGYFGTAVYPARAGDVMRIFRLQKTTGIGAGYVIGSAAMDRIFDGVSLFFLLLAALFIYAGRMQAQYAVWGVATFFVSLMLVGIVFVVFGHRLQRLFNWTESKWSWGTRLNRWYRECHEGLQILRSPKKFSCVLGLQLIISFLDVSGLWLLFMAFGWLLPFSAALVALIYLSAAISLPSSPGYVGVYQIAMLFALPAYGINEAAAVAYGTVLQLLNLVLFVVVGSWAYRWSIWSKPTRM